MGSVTMTVAKASEADLQAALKVANALSDLESGWWPADLEADDGSNRFDADNAEHCSSALNYLFSITKETSLFRVAFGMCTLMAPGNRIVDPDSDSLAHHPDRAALLAALERLRDWGMAAGGAIRYTGDHPIAIARETIERVRPGRPAPPAADDASCPALVGNGGEVSHG